MDLQEKILSAQEAQSALAERIRELEKELAAFNKWDAEKEKYELKAVTREGMLAYMLKPDAMSFNALAEFSKALKPPTAAKTSPTIEFRS